MKKVFIVLMFLLVACDGSDYERQKKLNDMLLNDFNNLFGGYYNKGASVNASFTGFSKANYYWSSAQYDNKDSTESYARGIEIYASYNNTIDDYNRSSLPKDYALSVRCVKNWM